MDGRVDSSGRRESRLEPFSGPPSESPPPPTLEAAVQALGRARKESEARDARVLRVLRAKDAAMRAHERALVEARAEALAAAGALEKEREARQDAAGRLAEALEARARLRARVEDLEQELGQRREASGAGSSSPGQADSSGCGGSGVGEGREAEEAGAEREGSPGHSEERGGGAAGSLVEVSDGRKSQASISLACGMGQTGREESLHRKGESSLSPSQSPAEHSHPRAPPSPGPTFGEPILSVSREDIVKPYRMRVRELEAALRRARSDGAQQRGAGGGLLGRGEQTEEVLDSDREMIGETEKTLDGDQAAPSSQSGPELSRLRCAIYAAIHRLSAALAAAGMALPPGVGGGHGRSDPGVLGLLSAAAAEAIAARGGAGAGEENSEPNEVGGGQRSEGTFTFRRPKFQEQLEVSFHEVEPVWSNPAFISSPVQRAPLAASPPAASESSLDWEEAEQELVPELSRGESERDLQRCLGLLLHRLDHGPPALLAPACRAAHAALLRIWAEASGQGPDELCEAGRGEVDREGGEEVGYAARLGRGPPGDAQRASKRGLLSDLDRGLESLAQQVARLETRGRTRGILLRTDPPR